MRNSDIFLHNLPQFVQISCHSTCRNSNIFPIGFIRLGLAPKLYRDLLYNVRTSTLGTVAWYLPILSLTFDVLINLHSPNATTSSLYSLNEYLQRTKLTHYVSYSSAHFLLEFPQKIYADECRTWKIIKFCSFTTFAINILCRGGNFT